MSKTKYTDYFRKQQGCNRTIAVGLTAVLYMSKSLFSLTLFFWKCSPLVSYFGSYPLKLPARLLSLSKGLMLHSDATGQCQPSLASVCIYLCKQTHLATWT